PLYQSRIRRMIKENMRDLRLLQAERRAAELAAKAEETALLEEAKLLLRLAAMDAETLDVKTLDPAIGSVFSNPVLRARLNRDLNLERARHYAKNGWNKAKTFAFEGLIIPQAA
ncbi:MAG TPA: hypothetical protein VNH18_23460, partial [Bryobacteraceae bacterium]|nr:hypothetical protein [Bryobacteraceae bacterium]